MQERTTEMGKSSDSIPRYSTDLHQFARSGQVEECQALVEAGHSVDEKDVFGAKPLHIAAMYGQEAVARYLIEKGASLNEKAYGTYTPLDLAIQYAPQAGVVTCLLEAGAKPFTETQNAKALFRQLALHFQTAEETWPEQGEVLLEKIEALCHYPSQMTFFVGEDIPWYALLKEMRAHVSSPLLYDRVSQTLSRLQEADKEGLIERFLNAKNVLHAFPIHTVYRYETEGEERLLLPERHYSIYGVEAASDTLTAYTDRLRDLQDLQNYEKIKEKYPLLEDAPFQSVEAFSQLKRAVFEKVSLAFQKGAKAYPSAGLYETSEELYAAYEAGETLVLATGWQTHSVIILLDKEKQLLIIANGGGDGQHHSGFFPGAVAYTMHLPLTVEKIHEICNNEEQVHLEFKQFYDLGLTYNPDYSFEEVEQAFANCTWYNQRIAEKALLSLELTKNVSQKTVVPLLTDLWFHELDDFHQTRVLEQYLEAPLLKMNMALDILASYHQTLSTLEEEKRVKKLLAYIDDHKEAFQEHCAQNTMVWSDDLKKWMQENGYESILNDYYSFHRLQWALDHGYSAVSQMWEQWTNALEQASPDKVPLEIKALFCEEGVLNTLQEGEWTGLEVPIPSPGVEDILLSQPEII